MNETFGFVQKFGLGCPNFTRIDSEQGADRGSQTLSGVNHQFPVLRRGEGNEVLQVLGRPVVRGKSHQSVPAGSCHFSCLTDPSQSVVNFPCVRK